MSDDPQFQGQPAATGTISGLVSRLSGYVATALRFWEPCRLIYNGALVLVVALHFIVRLPASRALLTGNSLLGLFFLAVLANVCYCVAYAIDLFVQFSGLERPWRTARWVVLGVGTAFAATIAHFFSTGIFSSAN